FQSVLRLAVRPEADAEFSDLGMDSLMAVEIRNRLNAELALEPPLPVTVLFDCPNLEALAARIEARLPVTERLGSELDSRSAGSEPGQIAEDDAVTRLARNVQSDSDHVQPEQKATANDQAGSLVFGTAGWTLTTQEERFWYLDHGQDGDPSLTLTLTVRINGRLDRERLEQAAQHLLDTQPALLQVFPKGEQGPVRAPLLHLPRPLIRWVELPADDLSEYAAIETIRSATRAPLRLESGPLFRFLAVPFGRNRTLLAVSAHHIIGDLRSLGLIIHGLLGKPRRGNSESARRVLPRQVALAQHGYSPRPTLAESRADSANAADAPPLFEPSSGVRGARHLWRAGVCTQQLPAALLTAMEPTLERYRASPGVVFLAAWRCLLSNLAERSSVPIIVPVDRGASSARHLVGLSAFPMHFEAGVALSDCFNAIVEDTARQLRSLAQTGDTTGSGTKSGIDSAEKRAGFLPEVLISPGAILDLPDVTWDDHTIESLPIWGSRTDFELRAWLIYVPAAQAYTVVLEYNAERLDQGSAGALLAKYFELLDHLTARPETPVIETLTAGPRLPPFSRWVNHSIRIAASFADDRLREQLEVWVDRLGMAVSIQSAGYGQILQTLLVAADGLSRADATLVFLRLEDLLRDRTDREVVLARPDRFEALLTTLALEHCSAIKRASAGLGAPLLVVLCPWSDFMSRDGRL
ncbi:MAG: hypothetical protein JSS43_20155, partial [Proteobacteria bacterium]|nr:hypothetical protein [Pseudomonadota bacterium]